MTDGDSPALLSALDERQLVEGIYMIQNNQLGTTRNGKPFLKCLLRDRSAQLAARMWNASEELYKTLPTDGFVRIAGQSQRYQGQIQIIVERIEPVEPEDADLARLLPTSERDPDEMFADLTAVLGRLEDAALARLARAYLEDESLMARFKQAPAAMSLHHAYLGGLLEHTLGLLRLAEAFCPLYPQINRDVVLLGLFLHDLAKCDELTWRRGFGYTDEGQLVGHIARGVIWLQRKADACAAEGRPVPEPLIRVLHHIILSHHGRPEHGALKMPATPEAIAVSLIDNLDAKMNMAIGATRGDGAASAGDFTERIWALETRLYRPDPTTVPEVPDPAEEQ